MKSEDMLSQTLRLDISSRLWWRKTTGVKGYSSEEGNYDILITDSPDGSVLLISRIHVPKRENNVWTKRFKTVKDAMVYAETM